MFEIENLLNLFSDEDIKEMLLYSYYLSQEKGKDLSDSVFGHLLFLKTINPRINIILDTTKEKSCFNPNDNVIYLTRLSIETFFHELTHLFSYNYSYFQVPNEYYSFKKEFLSSPKNTSLMIELLNLCNRKKTEFFGEDDINPNVYNITHKNEINNISQKPQSTQFDTIIRIEGIIDSIFDGQSFTHGLTSIKDNNSIAIKSQKASGHSCEYFSNSGYQFEEILADYQAIKLTDPNNDLFVLLKNIIGDGFISFLDQRCSEICGKFLKYENLNINNIIKK